MVGEGKVKQDKIFEYTQGTREGQAFIELLGENKNN